MAEWLAAVVAGAALIVSILSVWYSHRSVRISEEAKEVSKESAAQARRSADSAASVDKVERDRNHNMFEPAFAERCSFAVENINGDTLWCTFVPNRDYEIEVFKVQGASRVRIALTDRPKAGVPFKFMVEALPPEPQKALAQYLEFEVMPAGGWTCTCDRGMNGPHWVERIPVKTPRPPRPMIARA